MSTNQRSFNKPSRLHGTTPIWCEIVCDTCATQGPGQFTYEAIPRADLKRDALKAGWYLGPGGFVECKKCRRKRKDEPPETVAVPVPTPVVLSDARRLTSLSEGLKSFLGANLIPGDHPLPGGVRVVLSGSRPTVVVFDEVGPEPTLEE